MMRERKKKGKGKNQHVGLLGEQMSNAECGCSACIVGQLILKWMHLICHLRRWRVDYILLGDDYV